MEKRMMERNRRNSKRARERAAVLFICAMVMIAVMWHFSNQPAVVSSDTSGGISMKLARLIFGEPTETQFQLMEKIVRKTAHMTEFGMFTALLFLSRRCGGYRYPWAAFHGTLLAAASDECHQLFVPGRSCLLTDVIIDGMGGAFAVLLLIFLEFLYTRRKKRS